MMYRFEIKGVVQGVGFRPFVYNACLKAGLTGYVQNTGEGVIVEVDDKDRFIEILSDVPSLARVDSYEIFDSDGEYSDFTIKESSGLGFAEIPPDFYLCPDCLREMNDPKNRRHKYFFITCTNCGPRFSILQKSPYDRHTTSMSDFKMCDKCLAEYTNPADRRYHAQTIACPDCGPRLKLIVEGKEVKKENELECIKETASLIKQNKVVAIKGIGGFHLACNTTPEALAELRRITGRADKPYAIMCKDLDMANKIAYINSTEERTLSSVSRPIVVLKKKRPSLNEVSELDTIGIMLPYTALHYLLFDYLDSPVVFTSSNMPDQPISREEGEQIIDNILTHDRKIENSVDDSLVKVIGDKILFLRRSRGQVPKSISINSNSDKHILSLGAEMNNTFSVYKEGKVMMSQYMGTTSNLKSFENYKNSIDKFLELTDVNPDVILCDLHPSYNTSVYGEELSRRLRAPLVKIQHHLSHGYSVACENGLTDFASIVCDGLGFGEDNTLWGGEVFDNSLRVGHLEEHYQLGGDSAADHPAKMLFSILSKFLSFPQCTKYMRGYFSGLQLSILQNQLTDRFNCPLTTSTGRILDAAAFLLGFCDTRTYEARPAMLLEANSSEPYTFEPVIEDNVLLTTPLFKFLVENIELDKKRLAATVQEYIARGLFEIASKLNKPIVFSGGCAYNSIMTSFMLKNGVFINNSVPAGDGGISFGQIAYYLANSRNDIS